MEEYSAIDRYDYDIKWVGVEDISYKNDKKKFYTVNHSDNTWVEIKDRISYDKIKTWTVPARVINILTVFHDNILEIYFNTYNGQKIYEATQDFSALIRYDGPIKTERSFNLYFGHKNYYSDNEETVEKRVIFKYNKLHHHVEMDIIEDNTIYRYFIPQDNTQRLYYISNTDHYLKYSYFDSPFPTESTSYFVKCADMRNSVSSFNIYLDELNDRLLNIHARQSTLKMYICNNDVIKIKISWASFVTGSLLSTSYEIGKSTVPTFHIRLYFNDFDKKIVYYKDYHFTVLENDILNVTVITFNNHQKPMPESFISYDITKGNEICLIELDRIIYPNMAHKGLALDPISDFKPIMCDTPPYYSMKVVSNDEFIDLYQNNYPLSNDIKIYDNNLKDIFAGSSIKDQIVKKQIKEFEQLVNDEINKYLNNDNHIRHMDLSFNVEQLYPKEFTISKLTNNRNGRIYATEDFAREISCVPITLNQKENFMGHIDSLLNTFDQLYFTPVYDKNGVAVALELNAELNKKNTEESSKETLNMIKGKLINSITPVYNEYCEYYMNWASSFFINALSHLIDKVLYKNPYTIVLWKDGSKSIVKVQDNEKYDPEKGLLMCIMKRMYGNKSNYYDFIKQCLPEDESVTEVRPNIKKHYRKKKEAKDIVKNNTETKKEVETKLKKATTSKTKTKK